MFVLRVSFRFVNVRFTVEDGASLIFDLPKTRFGPNSGVRTAGGGGNKTTLEKSVVVYRSPRSKVGRLLE